MPKPVPSDLDFGQVLQGSFDEANGRLRVDAEITAPLDINGEVLVDVRAEDGDSVIFKGTQDGTPSGTLQIPKVNVDGSLNVTNVANVISTTANLTNITSTISSQLILNSNPNRKGFIMFNDSNETCFISFASSSSTTLFTIFLSTKMTYQNEAIIYTGPISVIWTIADGTLRVTELL